MGFRKLSGTLACVTVGGGQIGDTIFRDWNGNGIQDPQDEGLPACHRAIEYRRNGGDRRERQIFVHRFDRWHLHRHGGKRCASGLHVQTADPNGPPLSTSYTLTLTTNQQNLTVDFGYKPGGTGTIGDLVFEDKNKNAAFDGTDVGIAPM